MIFPKFIFFHLESVTQIICATKTAMKLLFTKFIKNICQGSFRSRPPEVFYGTVFLKIWSNSQENACLFLTKNRKKETSSFIKKNPLAQEFSCEFCQIFKNTFFHRTPLVAASGLFFKTCGL